jgi:hypothetical protein
MSADRDATVPTDSRFSRRHLLALGAAAGTGLVLAACGGSDDGATATTSPEAAPAPGGFVVAPRYPTSKALVPGEVRLAISLANPDGTLITDCPAELTGTIRNEQGEQVGTISAPRRGEGLGTPYWSITTTIATRGLYDFVLDGALGDATPFLVFDPSEVSVVSPGQPLPPFDTPTTAEARGVDPMCTRLDGPCPFHDVTLAEALALGKPVVYMIGTPAHCQFATCGPGLDFLMEASTTYADVATFVHAEVFSDPEGTKVAPAVGAAGLDYEPVIWVTDATGTVVQRIDIIWDQAELNDLLAAALA